MLGFLAFIDLPSPTPLQRNPPTVFPRDIIGEKIMDGGMSTIYRKRGIEELIIKTTGLCTRDYFADFTRYQPLEVSFDGNHNEEGFIITVEGREVQLTFAESALWRNSIFELVTLRGANEAHCGPNLKDYWYTLDKNNQLVMCLELEYVEGESIREELNGSWSYYQNDDLYKFHFGKCISLVGLELQRLHQSGIIHCDVKLDNIIINQSGPIQGRLIDFGISYSNDPLLCDKHSPPGLRTMLTQRLVRKDRKESKTKGHGSYGYAAPEMAAGKTRGTPATDTFSLGIVLWEVLMRRRFTTHTSYAPLIQFSRGDTDYMLDKIDHASVFLTRKERCAIKFALDRSGVVEPQYRNLDALIYAGRVLSKEE